MKYLFYIPALIVSLWTRSKERYGNEKGRSLDVEEQRLAEHIGIQDITDVRIHSVDKIEHPLSRLFEWIAQFSGKVAGSPIGLTLGHTVLLSKNCDHDRRLIIHELVHVQQYERMGGHIPFLMQYIYECLWFGYRKSPLEIEADKKSKVAISQIDSRYDH